MDELIENINASLSCQEIAELFHDYAGEECCVDVHGNSLTYVQIARHYPQLAPAAIAAAERVEWLGNRPVTSW